MRSLHTQQSVPAADLLKSGELTFVGVADGERVYRHDRPGTPGTDEGSIGSRWAEEPSDETTINALGA